MTNIIGNGLLVSALLIAVFNIIVSNLKLSKTLFYLSSILFLFDFLVLVYGFATSDFSIENVFLNSSTIKPLIFKISAAWASHEGSMLFWLCEFCLISLFYIYYTRRDQLFKIQATIISAIQILFGSFIYFTSNPFNALSFKPNQGLGLNPSLQDIALAIHPPILYLGYVLCVVPFVNSLILMIKSDTSLIEGRILKTSKIFIGVGLYFLTIGIGLGAWWAYRELGWGGYWSFDPVENISLMPWLLAIALYHLLNISIRLNRCTQLTHILSIVTFLSMIWGIFLVRSGLLISIHSFTASSERAIYLACVAAIITVSSLAILVTKSRANNSLKINQDKDYIINLSIKFWLISVILLIIATIYPIIYSYLRNQSISLSNNFFILSFIPVILVITGIAGVATGKKNSSLVNLVIALVIVLMSTYKVKYGFISTFAVVSSVDLILQTVTEFIRSSNLFKSKLDANTLAMLIGHIGFGMLIISITLNSLLSRESNFIGLVGNSEKFGRFDVGLKEIKFASGVNYYRQIAEFWIYDKSQNSITILKPENRYYQIEKSLSQESDIYSYLTHDLYAVLNKIDNKTVYAQIYYRPLISFIWLSVITIAIGFIISIYAQKRNPNY